MTDPDAPPAADPPPEGPERPLLPPPPLLLPPEAAAPDPTMPPPPPSSGNGGLAWLFALGFLLLAGGIGYVWWLTQQPPPGLAALEQRVAQTGQPAGAAQPAGTPAPGAADVQALEARVAALEHQPTPDLAALKARIAALQQREPPDLAPLEARVAALEHRPAPDLAPLQAQLAALQKQAADTGQMAARLDAVSTQVQALAAQAQALAARDQNTTAGLARRLDAAETRIAALEQTTTQMTATARQAARLARIEVAQAALAAGHPLGPLDGAPPDVAQFAAVSPPTEATLRLGFPKAEQAALAAAGPDTGGKPFIAQIMTRAEDLITVRQGDRVLLGNPAAGVLARAQSALDAGDLAGAVAAVAALSGPPAAAMAGWLADARGLLAARAGLAEMAAHA